MNLKFLSDFEAKELILEIGRRMYTKNYVAANDGNISCKTGPDTIWTTPTGVSKGYMKGDDLVKMGLDGRVIQQGKLKPSSEIKMHLRVYNENPEVCGVCHAHPPVSTSFAIGGISLDKAIYPEALVNLGTVPCVHYEAPGSQGIPDSIAPYCTTHNALLLANHGALAWGASLMEAWYRLESVEHYAMILMYTGNIIGKANVLSCDQVRELVKIREKLGIRTGGLPSCCVDRATNLADVGGSSGGARALCVAGVPGGTAGPADTEAAPPAGSAKTGLSALDIESIVREVVSALGKNG
ncbi:MAG: class II aldolase/adducin family protein [Spirochaetales bacterium]|jgi:L-fuculose-phosphate aldolase|nr:class II aldolase/adducin family protein [Spirochaetales bacterium]